MPQVIHICFITLLFQFLVLQHKIFITFIFNIIIVVNIEVQNCDKEESKDNIEKQGNGLQLKNDTEDQESKIQTKENKNNNNDLKRL